MDVAGTLHICVYSMAADDRRIELKSFRHGARSAVSSNDNGLKVCIAFPKTEPVLITEYILWFQG
jgi:hypothetical protein